MATTACCAVYRAQRKPRLAAIAFAISTGLAASAEALVTDYVDAQLRHLRLHS